MTINKCIIIKFRDSLVKVDKMENFKNNLILEDATAMLYLREVMTAMVNKDRKKMEHLRSTLTNWDPMKDDDKSVNDGSDE
jgi:hypothetical protein